MPWPRRPGKTEPANPPGAKGKTSRAGCRPNASRRRNGGSARQRASRSPAGGRLPRGRLPLRDSGKRGGPQTEKRMTRDQAFLHALLDRPEDDAPRLVYADWLEEHGDPRGEFIRL